MIKILFLAANPRDTNPLRLGEEMRAIKERLRLSDLRDEFAVEQEWAVRVADLQGHLLRHQPHVVHFSGHGSPAGEIILEDNAGRARPVSPAALKKLFLTLKDNIRCVVLNACYSEAQAKGIVEAIDCVIGMSRAIGDEAAMGFAASFYQARGYGRSIRTAFGLGCGQIDLAGLGEEGTPQLRVASGVDATQVFLARSKGKRVPGRPGAPKEAGQTAPPPPASSATSSTGEPKDPGPHYSCFISYSHRDEAFARELH